MIDFKCFQYPPTLYFFHGRTINVVFLDLRFFDSFLLPPCQEEAEDSTFMKHWATIRAADCDTRRGFDFIRKECGSVGPPFLGVVERMVHLALDGMGKG